MLPAAASAQERGDGKAPDPNKVKESNDIATGRPNVGGVGGYVPGRNRWFDKNNQYSYSSGGSYKPPVGGITDFGVKVGLNMQELVKSPFASQFKPGILGGIYARRYWDLIGIKADVLASTANYVTGGSAVPKSDFSTLYLSVPFALQIRVYHEIFVELGPQYSRLLTYKDKNSDYTKAYGKTDIFYKSEFSAFAGIDAQLPYNVRVNLRYIKGLTDVNNNVYPEAFYQWTINSIQLSFSYRLY